ncbi:MAG TPA: hypothetical protein DCP69_07535 [Candidatus Omnitrophica bacterium]|nr:hypothetical protein [Candidatus Omnitrophota bacterium]
MTITSPGTAAAPCEFLCGNDAAEPPTALATTATVTTTGANSINISGSLYCYGLTVSAGTGTASVSLLLMEASGAQIGIFDTCHLEVGMTSAASISNIAVGSPSGNAGVKLCRWINTVVKFANTSAHITVPAARLEWSNGSVDAAGVIPTALFAGTSYGTAIIQGVDLSALGSTKALVGLATDMLSPNLIIFKQCKLGASVSLTSGTDPGHGPLYWLDNCDSADTNYRMQRHQYEGDVYSETTVVRTGGASDATTPLSHKMVSSANSKFFAPLYGPEMVVWNDAVGSSQTVTCEILHDSVTALTDAEVWLETEYLGTTGFPLSLFASDRAADILATPANQAASSVAWTTTGMTNPNKQKLVTTQTPQEKGWYRCRVAVAKPSYTLYACPKLAVA